MPTPQYFFADLVREASRAGGTGALALDGILPGNRRFADVVPVGAMFGYAIAGIARPDEWETGTGRIDSAGHLERVSVAASSNAGARVDFSGTLKSVALTVGAGWFQAASVPPGISDVDGLAAALASKAAVGNYAASTHGHMVGDVTGLQAALDGKQAAGSYAAAAHGHVIGDVSGLQTALDGKQAAGSYAATLHGHVIGNVTGLQAALDGKQAAGSYAAAAHGHVIGDVSGLQTALDGKQPISTSFADATAMADSDKISVRTATGWSNVPAATLVRKTAAGRVGIGTSSPGQLLSVAGDIGIAAATDANIFFTSNTAAGARRDGIFTLDSGGNMVFRTSTAGSVFFDSFSGDFYFRSVSAGYASRLIVTTGYIMPGSDNSTALGTPSLRFSTLYAASGTIATSDRRAKKHIGPAPDAWLDAWGDVRWQRFRFRKGARWHVGLIAQEVRDAFAQRGIDGCALGLLCHDEVDGEEHWGLRYDECLAMEAAWQRRTIASLVKRISAIEGQAA